MKGQAEKRKVDERRGRTRFPIRRELRYKLSDELNVIAAGVGHTRDVSSGGVGFEHDGELKPGCFIELSISWPVLLDERCPMRLVVFGRVVRATGHMAACTIDKYEFRTQARTYQMPVRNDSMLQRWAGSFVKESVRTAAS